MRRSCSSREVLTDSACDSTQLTKLLIKLMLQMMMMNLVVNMLLAGAARSPAASKRRHSRPTALMAGRCQPRLVRFILKNLHFLLANDNFVRFILKNHWRIFISCWWMIIFHSNVLIYILKLGGCYHNGKRVDWTWPRASACPGMALTSFCINASFCIN